MSERVARRCDDTVDKKRVNSCVLKHLFLVGVQQPKTSPKKLGNAPSDDLLMSVFKISRLTPQKPWKKKNPRGFLKPRGEKKNSARFFKTAQSAVLINSLIQINSGPKI